MSRFTYDRERGEHRCPQGQALPRRKTDYTEHEIVYRAAAVTRNACPVKTRCTASDRGRIVHRSLSEGYLDTVRTDHATEAHRKAVRKRQVWVEPLFAEAKAWHGLRRLRLRGLRLRGLEDASARVPSMAAGQDPKRWLAATGRGRRKAPRGSPIALPKRSARLVPASA